MPLNRGCVYRERVPQDVSTACLLDYLADTHAHSSRDTWAARIDAGEVIVDGRRATVLDPIAAGQHIEWHRPPWHEPDVPRDFGVLFEDDALLAVNKPAGLPTMPAGGFLEQTLLTMIAARVPAVRPLHRLGRFTSGVVLFAKTGRAASVLARQWNGPEVEKVYRAIGSGSPPWDALEITTPIGPQPHPVLGTVHAASPAGRPAHSIARVLERRADGTTVFAVRIMTGRPHQIRIHLAWAGYPLAGDPLYGPGGMPVTGALPGDGGYRLHAETLRLVHPITGAPLTLAAPLPRDCP